MAPFRVLNISFKHCINIIAADKITELGSFRTISTYNQRRIVRGVTTQTDSNDSSIKLKRNSLPSARVRLMKVSAAN